MASRPHIVFVPGAWHRASTWQAVQQRLEHDGFETSALDLPSNRAVDAAGSNFQRDVEAVRSRIDELVQDRGADVVVVLHSYSGLVGSEALRKEYKGKDGNTGSVKAVVYTSAFLVPQGSDSTSVRDVNPESQNKHEFKDGLISVANPIEAFFHDIAADEAEAQAANLVGIDANVFSTIEITHDAYLNYPITYVFCENDRSIRPASQQSMVQKLRQCGANITTRSLNSGHDPMISQPDELVQIINEAIEASDI